MNLYERALMDKPSLKPGWCVICGRADTTPHHPVRRSQGGTNGPELELCGDGTRGHHGQAEAGLLEFRFTGTWEYLELDRPVKYEKALEMQGWKRL